MEIRPIKQEYILSVASHTMRAVVLHEEDVRQLSYYFDDKLITQKTMPDGQYYTDDECISEVVDEYRKNKKDVYSDLLNRHIDKVHLTSKILEVELNNYGVGARAKAKIVKDFYEVEIASGEDVISGRFKANRFPEVLEKMRMFVTTLAGVSDDLTKNITLLSSDKIEEAISWE